MVDVLGEDIGHGKSLWLLLPGGIAPGQLASVQAAAMLMGIKLTPSALALSSPRILAL